MKNSGFVTAYRGAMTKDFTRKAWDDLGSDKYGWTIVPEVPKEVASIPAAKPIEVSEPTIAAETSQEPAPVQTPAAPPAKTHKSKKRKK